MIVHMHLLSQRLFMGSCFHNEGILTWDGERRAASRTSHRGGGRGAKRGVELGNVRRGKVWAVGTRWSGLGQARPGSLSRDQLEEEEDKGTGRLG